MASDIWLRTILIVRKENRCRHIGYSYRLTARVLLYAPSHRQDNTYHGLCYTSRGALAGTRNSSMGPPHEGSIRRPTAPWANALPLSYVPLQDEWMNECLTTPQHENRSAIGCQNKVAAWYGYEIKKLNIYHRRRKRGEIDWGGGGNGMFVPPTFNHTFLFSTWIICLYNTDK